MEQPVPSPSTGDDRTRRRGLFSGRAHATPADSIDVATEHVEELVAASQATIQRQLEEGLQQIQSAARSLMHEIASEVWRTAGADKDQVRDRIVHELSRDQALRSLLAHSDERFQALVVRTARLEDTLNHVAESVRSTKDQLAKGAGLFEHAAAGGDVSALRSELAQLMRQVASALGMLAERDEAIVEAVKEKVKEHGELITHETTRISAAMEAYVQQGVEAIGQLAGSMDTQVRALAARDDEITGRIAAAVEEQMGLISEQLQLMYERISLDTTAITDAFAHQAAGGDVRVGEIADYLHHLNERVDVVAREGTAEIRRALETRVLGLAQLVRSDSEALRGELARTAQGLDERSAALLDDRLAALSSAVTDGTRRMIDEATHRMQEDTAHAIRAWVDEALARLESHAEEQAKRFDGRTEEALSAIDRNMVRMTDAIEVQFERLGRGVGERTAQAADAAIGERFDDVLARLHDATGTVERLHLTVERAQTDIEQGVADSVGRQMAALARLIRADNEALATQIVADQDASKQALRATKELQANLPGEVTEMFEERFASLAESIERSNEMLAKRIDTMAAKIGERYDNDIQVVVDRMGDAMHALASLGRPSEPAPRARVAETRIELD